MEPPQSTETSLPAEYGGARFLPLAAWGLAIGLVLLAVFLGWRIFKGRPGWSSSSERSQTRRNAPQPFDLLPVVDIDLPEFNKPEGGSFIQRQATLHTVIPSRPRQEVVNYTVQAGDSVFEIANQFQIKPETVLWANYDVLNDNPDMISPGIALKIPPADGVLYEWQSGDTLEAVVSRFTAKVEDVINWSGNRLDLVNPQILAGTLILIPGGEREFRQWVIPTIPRGNAGVSAALYGAGACEGNLEGAYGTGTFTWPAGNHYLTGNDYWDGHLGIDIGAGEGLPLVAADSGVVVFAGWANGGYGNMVMIDHGNGYQTLYAHMSQVTARCGNSVSKGGTIGYAGNTGNSTGPHLHFEVRYLGGFVNPWYVLPAP